MLSLCELRRAVRVLEKGIGDARIRRLLQPDAYSLILSFERPTAFPHILISCKPELARICTVADLPKPPSARFSFYEFVRAHLLGSTLAGITVSENDRQIRMCLRTQFHAFVLILSIMGARSNIYVLDDSERLMHSVRSLHETRRELSMGEAWKDPQDNLRSRQFPADKGQR